MERVERLVASARPVAAFALFVLAAGPMGAAQAQSESSDASSASSEPMEEVIVRGQRNLRQLYNEAGRATQRFYDLLNVYLDDDEMRVTCRLENRPNSLIRERVCRTGFQQSELSQQGRAQVASVVAADGDIDAFMGTAYDPGPALAQKQREFDAKVMEAVNSDAQLNRAVWDLIELKREIERRENGGRRR